MISPAIRLGVLTGFLGGFSTFSTFAMETYLLAEQGEWGKGALYILLSVLLGLAATAAGVFAEQSRGKIIRATEITVVRIYLREADKVRRDPDKRNHEDTSRSTPRKRLHRLSWCRRSWRDR